MNGGLRRETLALTAAIAVAAVAACGDPVSGDAADDAEVRMAPPVGEGAQRQWPQWRGPTRQGLVQGDSYRDRWDDDLADLVWKVAVPGEGHSSPIIWEDRIFLTTSHDFGERVSVLCFSREDGELLWETFVPSEADPERIHNANTFASSTPVTDGERVYAYFGNHGIVAVDFQGEVVWHESLGQIAPHHGHGGSPLLYDDKLIMYQDHGGSTGSFVAAWDRETGEQLWRTSRSEGLGWGSPIVVRLPQRDELITSSHDHVRVYNPDTGELLWYAEGMEVEVIPTPVVGAGLVINASASWRERKPTLAIRPGGEGDVTRSHVVWSEDRHSPFLASPVIVDGLFYMIDDQAAILSCYDAATGELLYREQFNDEWRPRVAQVNLPVSMVAVNDRIFATAQDGRTWVFRAGPDYELLHVNQLPDSVMASPALLDGRWYWRTSEHLLVIDAE